MKKSNPPMSCLFVALLFVLSVCSCSAASTCPLVQTSRAADSDKTGYSIVVLEDGTTHKRFKEIKSELESIKKDGKVRSVERVVKAFTVKLSDDDLTYVSIFNHILQQLLRPAISWCMEFHQPCILGVSNCSLI